MRTVVVAIAMWAAVLSAPASLAQALVPAAPGAQAAPPQPGAADQPGGPRISAPQPGQPIPFRKDEGLGEMMLNVGLGLAIAIGAGVGVLLFLRRHLSGAQNAPGRRLRVLETVRLGPKSALFLVELDGRSLLVGQQGDSLAVLNQQFPAASGAPPSAGRAG